MTIWDLTCVEQPELIHAHPLLPRQTLELLR